MAIALMAWFSAPGPMACTSPLPAWRTTPASAPATALGFDLEDTFRTSISGPSYPGTSTWDFLRPSPTSCWRRTVCPLLLQALLTVRCPSTPLRRHSGQNQAFLTLGVTAE